MKKVIVPVLVMFLLTPLSIASASTQTPTNSEKRGATLFVSVLPVVAAGINDQPITDNIQYFETQTQLLDELIKKNPDQQKVSNLVDELGNMPVQNNRTIIEKFTSSETEIERFKQAIIDIGQTPEQIPVLYGDAVAQLLK